MRYLAPKSIGIIGWLATAAGFADIPLLDLASQPFLPPKGHVCYRAGNTPRIDGRLDEENWQKAPWSDDFVDIEGEAKPRPRLKTRVKMLWDDECFYIGAEIEEPHVWATLTQHDAVIFHDHDFEVFIDPDGDNHEYYEIEINALNTEWDLFLKMPYKDGGPAENSWEIPGLKHAVFIEGTLNQPAETDQGWSVELAFPWKALAEFAHRPAPPRDGDQWRINFSRVEWDLDIAEGKYKKIDGKPEHNWVWSPQRAINMHLPERWGYVQFSNEKAGGQEVPFRTDRTGPARHLLHQLYYAQKAYREKHQQWAAGLSDLGPSFTPPDESKNLSMRLEKNGFQASLDLPSSKNPPQKLIIDQHSRIQAK